MAPTDQQIRITSTMLAMGKPGAVASVAKTYNAFKQPVTSKNILSAKARIAHKLLGIDSNAQVDNGADGDSHTVKLRHIIDTCASCTGKELKGLYTVPAIGTIKNSETALIIGEIIKVEQAVDNGTSRSDKKPSITPSPPEPEAKMSVGTKPAPQSEVDGPVSKKRKLTKAIASLPTNNRPKNKGVKETHPSDSLILSDQQNMMRLWRNGTPLKSSQRSQIKLGNDQEGSDREGSDREGSDREGSDREGKYDHEVKDDSDGEYGDKDQITDGYHDGDEEDDDEEGYASPEAESVGQDD
ncbi:hypothetical protein PG984_006951 [Apiospora sp. TS-2023a]